LLSNTTVRYLPVPSMRPKLGKEQSRVVLTDVQASDIYRCKLHIYASAKSCLQDVESKTRTHSNAIGKKFGVSGMAIRDIWSRRTWIKATASLWYMEHIMRSTSDQSQSVLVIFLFSCKRVCSESNATHSHYFLFFTTDHRSVGNQRLSVSVFIKTI